MGGRVTLVGRIQQAGGAEIGERRRPDPILLGQEVGEGLFQRDDRLELAAERLVIARRGVPGTHASDLEAAEIVTAHIEPIVDPHGRAPPAADITGVQVGAEDPIRGKPVVPAGASVGLDVFHGAAKARKILRHFGEEAAGRVERIVPVVPAQGVSDQRGDRAAPFGA